MASDTVKPDITVKISAGVQLYRGGQPHPFPGGAALALPAEHADALHELKHVEKIAPSEVAAAAAGDPLPIVAPAAAPEDH